LVRGFELDYQLKLRRGDARATGGVCQIEKDDATTPWIIRLDKTISPYFSNMKFIVALIPSLLLQGAGSQLNDGRTHMLTRRSLLQTPAAGAMAAGLGTLLPLSATQAQAETTLNLSPELPEGTRTQATLDALPGKRPLIKLSYRPPNYETPIGYLGTVVTPNDAFFVRCHLADIPQIDAQTWMLASAAREQKERPS
jgi:hypothetical protein